MAYFGEILLNAGELACSLGMKRLERARFLGVTEAARREAPHRVDGSLSVACVSFENKPEAREKKVSYMVMTV